MGGWLWVGGCGCGYGCGWVVAACCNLLQQPTVSQHFASVPSEVQFVAYVNHEAVPEHDGDIHNYFTEVCLFKQNPNVFKRQPQEVRLVPLFQRKNKKESSCNRSLPAQAMHCGCALRAVASCVECVEPYIQRRPCLATNLRVGGLGSSGPSGQNTSCSKTKKVCLSISPACTCPSGGRISGHKRGPPPTPHTHPLTHLPTLCNPEYHHRRRYFLAYANGKSAVRLNRPSSSSSASAATVLPRPYTVHRWRGQEVVGTYWQPQEACVLHYAQCGTSAFQRKFQVCLPLASMENVVC